MGTGICNQGSSMQWNLDYRLMGNGDIVAVFDGNGVWGTTACGCADMSGKLTDTGFGLDQLND